MTRRCVGRRGGVLFLACGFAGVVAAGRHAAATDYYVRADGTYRVGTTGTYVEKSLADVVAEASSGSTIYLQTARSGQRHVLSHVRAGHQQAADNATRCGEFANLGGLAGDEYE